MLWNKITHENDAEEGDGCSLYGLLGKQGGISVAHEPFQPASFAKGRILPSPCQAHGGNNRDIIFTWARRNGGESSMQRACVAHDMKSRTVGLERKHVGLIGRCCTETQVDYFW